MKPNVIVFFTDQQRFDTTGVHGNPLSLTPNFDRLAARGTHVTHAFTPQPVCGPSRACMQTGKYATTTGCFRNGIPLPENETTLAGYFKGAGYETAYIGKWHLADSEKYVGAVPEEARGGYDTWLAANLLEFVSDAYDLRLFDITTMLKSSFLATGSTRKPTPRFVTSLRNGSNRSFYSYRF